MPVGPLAPDSAIDVRHFRPNIVVGGTDIGFAEDAWVGHRIRIGTMTARVEIRTMRCVMVTRPFSDLPNDRSIMRTLVRERAQCIGVYASVEQPGVVTLGDTVEILD